MHISKHIKKQKQIIARDEKALAMAKLKKRKAQTRRKIELGGLVIKSGMDGYSKSTILGALNHCISLMSKDEHYKVFFTANGETAFLETNP